jgi:hypothetical protein
MNKLAESVEVMMINFALLCVFARDKKHIRVNILIALNPQIA